MRGPRPGHGDELTDSHLVGDPVAEEADPAAGPRLGDDGNAQPRQLTEVTVDRPLGDLETSREIGCRDLPRTRTEDDDLRNQASSFQVQRIVKDTDTRCQWKPMRLVP